MSTGNQKQIDRIWEVIEKAGVCMMSAPLCDGLRVRPMVTLPSRSDNAIWCFTDRRGLRDDEIEMCPEVYLTFVYPNENVYLALTGEAFVNKDPKCAREVWDKTQEEWWSGPDDPNLLLIRIELWRAEMWDSPVNCAIADFQFTKARLFGTKANLGENRKVTVELF
ncbi:MAG: pyridoxamine 5'-phosphate oxidase family protein [Hyphomicrobiales bacterium]